MTIKKGDFIEIDYVGRIKESGEVFDVTNTEAAKQHNIYNPKAYYHSQIICVGENQVVPGLDAALVGKEEKKSFAVELAPEKAFGKKDAKLMQLVPLKTFQQQQINPFPGLRVSLNKNTLGVVRTVSGGRVIVDFNHPLAGRNVVYEVTIHRLITQDTEKLKGIIRMYFQRDAACSVKDGKAHIDLPLEGEVQQYFITYIQKLIPGLKEVTFARPQKQDKEPAAKKQ